MVGSTICFCVRSRSIGCLPRRVFFDGLLLGRAGTGSDDCDNFCFGLELLIQPLKLQPCGTELAEKEFNIYLN